MAFGSYGNDQYGLNSDSYSLYNSANNDRYGNTGYEVSSLEILISTDTCFVLKGLISVAKKN